MLGEKPDPQGGSMCLKSTWDIGEPSGDGRRCSSARRKTAGTECMSFLATEARNLQCTSRMVFLQ